MQQCGKPSCNKKIKIIKKCSGCLIQSYCSTECQKDDWKIHKIICPYLKQNDNLPMDKVTIVSSELQKQAKFGTISEIRILKFVFLLSSINMAKEWIGLMARAKVTCINFSPLYFSKTNR